MVAIDYEMFVQIVATKGIAVRIACFRNFGEHYQVSGPAGVLDRKVSRSFWPRILDVQQGVVA
ncbi:hypothetical protein [Lysobacter gummosus]|uniref:hypothetical protein n=1 Tax=Lysobacter gummosus TaxID=262324 RepID=UPI003644EB69